MRLVDKRRYVRALKAAVERGEPQAVARYEAALASARAVASQETAAPGQSLDRLSVPQLRVLRALLAIAAGDTVDGRKLVHDLLSLAVEALTRETGAAVQYRVARLIEFLSGRQDVPSDSAPAVLPEEPEPPPPAPAPEMRREEPVAAAAAPPVVAIDAPRGPSLVDGLERRTVRWSVPEF